ncbi:MAG: hypothetical protein D3923_06515 [Candidatus Electrothrix sp. AR3]|nr:hypothetical protein [Candidatus Electrothrix sp. AR3]
MSAELTVFANIKWVKPLWKKLRQLTGERAKELNRLRDLFVDPEELAKFYVEPHTQDRNPADVLQDDLLTAARQPAFARVNEFFRGSLPLEKDGRHQMFILSDAGMGKTSLLLMVKLMHLTNFWPQGQNCELFKLGANTLKEIAAIKNKGDTFLLLDALDEDPHAWKRIRERLLELLGASEDFRRVIISSRTQFFPEMESDSLGRAEIKVLSGYCCPVLYLSPFNDEQVQEFLEKRIPLCWHHRLCLQKGRIEQQRKRADHLLEQMQDLRMRPMLLQHIDKLLEVDVRQEWNAYTVYEALIQQWLNREVRKLLEQHTVRTKIPEQKDLFLACVRIAERMERLGSREIDEDELQALIREDSNICWLEKFELGGRSLLNRNSDRAFRFSHYTIQEFLLAWGLVNECLLGQEQIRATDQLVRFIDLADGIFDHADQVDLTAFDPFRYVELYATPWPFQDRLHEKMGPEMIILPSGRFRMGDIQGKGSKDERPVHEVELDGFALGRYPVTFAEYDIFCEATGREKPRDEDWGRGLRPVINVSWQDAHDYCVWLSEETGQVYRLPSEAEWEYACRAGSASAYCFGDDAKLLGEYAWYNKNFKKQTHPVGEKKANVWGLHDMHGNVLEWCVDCYDEKFYADSPMRNPLAEKERTHRVVRGGSWYDRAGYCRSAYRERHGPDYRYDDAGFRCVRVQVKQESGA